MRLGLKSILSSVSDWLNFEILESRLLPNTYGSSWIKLQSKWSAYFLWRASTVAPNVFFPHLWILHTHVERRYPSAIDCIKKEIKKHLQVSPGHHKSHRVLGKINGTSGPVSFPTWVFYDLSSFEFINKVVVAPSVEKLTYKREVAT